jgi:uncharacterized surface protein with fasciclin (FAS1) repeats
MGNDAAGVPRRASPHTATIAARPAREYDDTHMSTPTTHPRSRFNASASPRRASRRALCTLGLFVFVFVFVFVAGVADARYRGRAVGGRRISGRGLGPRAADRVGIGRKLLVDAPPPSVLPENGHCVTAYETARREPDLSELTKIIDTLPRIKEKLQDPTLTFTLFAPTNEALQKLREWEDWDAARKDLIETFGSDRAMRAWMLAYHAVPNVSLTMKDLENLRGDDDVVLEDYLNNVMPLVVLNSERPIEIAGLGSEARVVESDLSSCGAVVHKIDHVLLPFDGDDFLDAEQRQRLIFATNALRRRYGREALPADVDRAEDLIDAVGAVSIESVPTSWTRAALSEYENDDDDDDE